MAGAQDRQWVVVRPSVPALVWPAAAGVGVAVAAYPALTVQAQLTVAVVGATICILAARRGRTDLSARVPATVMLPWLGLGLALCLWELAMRLVGNDDAWPTLSILMGPVADANPLGRFLLGVAWTVAGSYVVRMLP